MRNFIIEKFASHNGNVIWTRNNHNGFYESPGQEAKGCDDFICQQGYYIREISRAQQRGQLVRTHFAVGARLSVNVIIHAIKIVKNKAVIVTSLMTEIPLAEAQLAPTRTEVQRPATVQEVFNTAQRTTSKIDLKTIQSQIEASYRRSIRLEKTLRNRPEGETLEKFLITFFKKWNLEKNTIFTDDNSVQTVMGKRRSLGDIYMLCKYYYPNTTLAEVVQLLYVTLHGKITDGFRTSKCSQIKKRVWYYDANSNNGIYNQNDPDEYNNTWKSYIN